MEDERRRRHIRRFRMHMNNSVSAEKIEAEEAYKLGYYLYHITKYLSNKSLVNIRPKSAINLFINCVDSLGKMDRLNEFLDKKISQLEKKHDLKLNDDYKEEPRFFDDTDIRMIYQEDRYINHTFDPEDENTQFVPVLIKLCRCLLGSKKPYMNLLIANTIFSDKEKFSNSISISKDVQNKIINLSDTQFLINTIGLTVTEANYLYLKYQIENNIFLNNVILDLGNTDINRVFADILGIKEKELDFIERSDQKLKSYGLIERDNDYNSDLDDCFKTKSIEPFFSDFLKIMDCSSAYDAESFSVSNEAIEILEDFVKGPNPFNILFYGKPGSGKTELARTIGKISGKKVYIFKNDAEFNYNDNRLLSRLNCLLSMKKENSILIIDEAESLLKTASYSFFGTVPANNKGAINKMLETNRSKIIWIINHTKLIDESTLRRFTYSLKFDSMPVSMLKNIAGSKISGLKIKNSSRQKLLEMFTRYNITGSSVDNIVKIIQGMSNSDEEKMLSKAEAVMKENSLLINGKTKIRKTACKNYDLSIVNSTVAPEKLVKMVENAIRFSEKNKSSENGIRMLFYGMSGTGKTELVRYMAEKLGKPVLLKRASDILGCYVGESEKNIRDAFEEAERTESILLFDEADSFFQDRNGASHSWEITQVNEFLTQMEEFNGILICTTNLRKIMDPAMQRRFHILTEFKALNHEGIEKLCAKYFSSLNLSSQQIDVLDGFGTITPGDFSSLYSQIRFMDEEEVTAENIFNQLVNIQKEKKKNKYTDLNLGFTA